MVRGHCVSMCGKVSVTTAEVESLQAEDPTLVAVRATSKGSPDCEALLLQTLWAHLSTLGATGCRGAGLAVEQLVLPVQCQKAVVMVANRIPMAGHMERLRQQGGSSSNSTGRRCTTILLSILQ